MKRKLRQSQNLTEQRNTQLNRRQLFKKGGIIAGVVAALSFTPFPLTENSAHASTNPIQIISLTGVQASKYIEATVTSNSYKQFLSQLDHQYPHTFNVQETHIKVSLIQTTSDKVVSIHVPIQGGAGYSFYNIAMLLNATILTTRSGLFLPEDKGNISALIRQNNQIVFDAILTSTGNFLQGTLIARDNKRISLQGLSPKEVAAQVIPPTASGSGNWWSCINNCLSGEGIASWVVGAVGIACAVACIGTAGVACVVCIAGAAGITGGAAGYCVADCSN